MKSVSTLMAVAIVSAAVSGRGEAKPPENEPDGPKIIARASGVYHDRSADKAFDGDLNTWWGAGDNPPQWIEANLGRRYVLKSISLTVAQTEPWETAHEVWISDKPMAGHRTGARLLFTFRGMTQSGQVLKFDFPAGIVAQYVEVRTVESRGWTAWKEIDIRTVEIDAPAKTENTDKNVALGKKVTSLVPESPTYSHKRNRGAEKLVDGDWKTLAYPGAFKVDYVIDLKKSANGAKPVADFRGGYQIDKLLVHWGVYGRHCPGEKDKNGHWKPASYKANYVNYYRIDYRTSDVIPGKWLKLHEHQGLPTDEEATRIKVVRDPLEASSSEGVVTTHIENLDLADVTEIRIRAIGNHWIGIRELEAIQGHKPLQGEKS